MKKYSISDWILMGIFDIIVISAFGKISIVLYFIDMQKNISYVAYMYSYITPYLFSMILILWGLIIGTGSQSAKSKLLTFMILIPCVIMFSNMDSSYITVMIPDPTLQAQCYAWLRNTDTFCMVLVLFLSGYLTFSNNGNDFNSLTPGFNGILIGIGILFVLVIPEIITSI